MIKSKIGTLTLQQCSIPCNIAESLNNILYLSHQIELNDSLGGKDQVATIEIQLQSHLNPSVATKFKPNLGCHTNAVPACYSTGCPKKRLRSYFQWQMHNKALFLNPRAFLKPW